MNNNRNCNDTGLHSQNSIRLSIPSQSLQYYFQMRKKTTEVDLVINGAIGALIGIGALINKTTLKEARLSERGCVLEGGR